MEDGRTDAGAHQLSQVLQMLLPPKNYSETLAPKVMVLGGGAFGNAHVGISALWKGPREQPCSVDMGGHGKKVLLITNTKSASALILDVQPSELQEIHFCCS